IDPLVAHFVVFYSALLSALTPPVCTAVFTAAVIAKTDWFSVSLVSMRLALMKYLMPVFFVFRPAVLLEAGIEEIIWSLVMGLVASMLMAIGGGRFYRQRISVPLALLLVVVGALVAANKWWLDLIAILVLAAIVITQRRAVWLEKRAGA
ncbi:TRAP transporter large permease subunit, partial [Sneathiella sp.]|uniref:TRAP transporter large permease subunit n=1 Tax=Sneathiella sp. TaxID=1964365 RepID=UPI0035629C69